jgi:hypothetical protein
MTKKYERKKSVSSFALDTLAQHTTLYTSQVRHDPSFNGYNRK